MTTSTEDPLVGLVLDGRYRVLRRVAEGGMGVVYEAEQSALHRSVAIKVLRPHLAQDPDLLARFRREAKALSAISHANVVEVFDFGQLADGRHFLVLEFLRGQELAALLRSGGPLSVGATARILSEVARGVGAAHAASVVHRDLKPENVFVLDATPGSERVKVVDFGVARLADVGLDAKTRTGLTVGTPYTMSPEQAQGRSDIDHRTDVYSLGAMAFRMLTGHHPFDGDSVPMIVVKICTEPPPRIVRWREDVPRELERLIERMLAKSPGERPGTMDEVVRALAPFAKLDMAPRLTSESPPGKELPAIMDLESQPTLPRGATLPAVSLEVVPRPLRVPPWLAAVPIVGLLGAAVWWAQRDREVPQEPAPAPLPTPAAPRTVSMGSARSEEGWVFVNPRPRLMPQWNAIANAGAGRVAMVGASGTAARFYEGRIVTWQTGTELTLRAVAWTGVDEVLVAGEAGVIARLDLHAPRRIESGTQTSLRAVAATRATEAIVAGDAGTLLLVRGNEVTPIAIDGDPDLLSVAALSDGTAVVVGEAGLVLEVEAGRVRATERASTQTLRSVVACDGGLVAVGDEGTIVRRGSDGSWRAIRVDPPTNSTFHSVTCRGRQAIAVGSEGEVRVVSGLRSVRFESDFAATFTGVAASSGEATWAVGTSGRLATIEDDHVATRVTGPIASLRDVADIGGAMVAVGDWGALLRETEGGLVLDHAPTEAGLGAVVPLGDGSLVAVGDGGALVRIRFDGSESIDSPATRALRGIVAAEGRLLAVGLGGIVVRGTPEVLSLTHIPDAPDLASVAGSPDDAVAVGDGGFVVHLGPLGSRRISCPTSASLKVITRVDGTYWAAGENGTIVAIEGDTCRMEHRFEPSGPTLRGIGRGPRGVLMAVGDMGRALERWDGRWGDLPLDVGIVGLRSVRTVDRWVVVVGAGGLVLRHIRVDGG